MPGIFDTIWQNIFRDILHPKMNFFNHGREKRVWVRITLMTSNRERKSLRRVLFHACYFTIANEMPSRCVVFGCSNTPDPKNGITLHRIPYSDNIRPEAIERRKFWVDFVKRKHAKWKPSGSSCVCSKHFKRDDFVRNVCLPGQEISYISWLKRDDIGVTPDPSVLTVRYPKEDHRTVMYMRYRNFIIIIIISFQGERQKPFDAT